MATLFVDKIDPQSGTSLRIGSSGDTIALLRVLYQSNNVSSFCASVASTIYTASTRTKIRFNTEILDTIMLTTTTNYRFTVQWTAGKYYY